MSTRRSRESKVSWLIHAAWLLAVRHPWFLDAVADGPRRAGARGASRIRRSASPSYQQRCKQGMANCNLHCAAPLRSQEPRAFAAPARIAGENRIRQTGRPGALGREMGRLMREMGERVACSELEYVVNPG
jgi:hypothetical protein